MLSGSTLESPYHRKGYAEMVDDILDLVIDGSIKEKHKFKNSRTGYPLRFTPFNDNVEVNGTAAGAKRSFRSGTDYSLSEDKQSLNWIGTTSPDEGSEFIVKYSIKPRSGLTDRSEGSVLRTLVEAVCKEMDELAGRMDDVYRSGFIDTATGTALDGVTALLGIRRKPPTRAIGAVSFWREGDPGEKVINNETVFYDGRPVCKLGESSIKSISSVKGSVNGVDYVFANNKDFSLDATNSTLVWLDGGAIPDMNTPLSIDYKVYEKISIPRGTIVGTSSTSSGARLFETLHESTLQKSKTGRWEANVQVRSLESGPQGNVMAGTITKMPKPPVGVEQVVNVLAVSGGADYETDEALRLRAKGALELAGRATVGALRSSLEAIEGVQLPVLIKENPNGVPGLIKVVVDGGDRQEIEKAKEATRAAGIRVEVDESEPIFLDFLVSVLPKDTRISGANKEALTAKTSLKIKNFVGNLKIGEDLVYNQLLSAILGIEEVRDVKHLTIGVYKKDKKIATALKGDVDVGEYQRAHPRSIEITIQEDEKLS